TESRCWMSQTGMPPDLLHTPHLTIAPGAVIVGLFLFAFLGAALVALGLGIAGLLQKERKKLFAILGTVFSAVSLVVTIFIMIIGSAMG
ncbi:hypothetical protein, partial [Aeromonas sanarellii]